MTQNSTYTLSINYNYDQEQNLIIETRTIKKNMSFNKQFIKGSLKEYSAEVAPEIFNELKEKNRLMVETKLNNEQVDMAMDKSFDLFADIKRIFSNDNFGFMNRINPAF